MENRRNNAWKIPEIQEDIGLNALNALNVLNARKALDEDDSK